MSTRDSLENKTRLSWWFPRIPSDILTPKTIIVGCGYDLINLLDGKTPPGFDNLCSTLIYFGDQLGWPLFLRTDYLSGKYDWEDTCYVPGPDDIPRHVAHLVGESALADIMGFPTDRWIARELIPTQAAFSAFRGKMPIVKERRYFVQDSQVMCHHPYWPPVAFNGKSVFIGDWKERLFTMNYENDEEVRLLSKLSSKVGAAIGGAWSIDWLWSEQRGQWYLTDMAEAGMSYHWPGCPMGESK